METIQKYRAFDGKIFDSIEDCKKYEDIAIEVKNFLASIEDSEKYNEGCNFSNGNGFIQHPQGTYKIIENKLVELSNKYFKQDKPFTQFNYYLGRIIDDSNMKCLNKLSYKLMCTDSQEREFGQPYYTSHPEQATLIQLNK